MNEPKRHYAFLAYFVPILGWLYVLLLQKKDKFAVYHAKQSIMLTIMVLVAPVIWGAVAWILTWIPLAGAIIAAALFALVILTYIFLAAVWVVGMAYALQAKVKPLPIVGGWAERISIGGQPARR